MTPSIKKPTSVSGIHEEPSISSNGKPPIIRDFNDEKAWKYLTLKRIVFLVVLFTSLLVYYAQLPFYLFPVLFCLILVPVFPGFIGFYNLIYTAYERKNQVSRIDHYIEFIDEDTKKQFSGKFIPIRDLYELFADQKINFKHDVLESLNKRDEYVSYKLQMWHLKFFLTKFLPEMFHSKEQDHEQVTDHYDRGNDFYESFLGPMMIYTSGIMHSKNDSLEDMQSNKLANVCKKINLKSSDRVLDIGCGWGTLTNYISEKHGAQATGVSIAQNQIDWAENNAKTDNGAKFICSDYRDIPAQKYDKITCLEMSEHVGIRLYPNFLKQVSDMLEDDGLFYLQIAGIRRAWQWEDFMWAFFMDTYVFPGAEASLPLTFPVAQLEAAGFEVQSVETIGVHYSETIKRWYYNWVKAENKAKMISRYGIRLYRIWEIFLAWSTIIARQGNSTCYQIVAHKNLNNFDRHQFMKTKEGNQMIEH